MIVRYLLAALVAGLFSGVFMTLAQEVGTVPIILKAETYEGGAAPMVHPSEDGATEQNSSQSLGPAIVKFAMSLNPVSPAYADNGADDGDGGIMFGMSRFSGTLLANLVASAGFALVLAGFSLVSGRPVTVANGVLWGIAGWLAIHMLPSLGLPPGPPGFPNADVVSRKIWWTATVFLSVGGIYLLALVRGLVAKIGGLLLLIAPHVYGAPKPDDIISSLPAYLGAEFAVAALGTTLFFWMVLGLALGFTNEKIARSA